MAPNPNIAIYSGGDPTDSTVSSLFSEIKAGPYTTVILWGAHIDPAGDITMNDDLIVQDGVFQSTAQAWAKVITGLKTNSTITRIELSIGGDSSSWDNIKALIEKDPSANNQLYKNLSVLKNTIGLDAINYDDESTYDPASSGTLAQWCVDLKMQVSICPYNTSYSTYWADLVNSINAASKGTADAIYLQCYDGGVFNQPDQWNGYFKSTGLTVAPGLWAVHNSGGVQCSAGDNSTVVENFFATWAPKTTLAGGFMFCGTDIQGCTMGGTAADYANAIKNGLSKGS